MSANQIERVSIADDPDETGQVMVRNTLGKEQSVRSDLRANGTAPPAKGEVWLMWCPVGSPKMLLARVGHPDRPVVTGSRAGASALTLSLLAALGDLNLIDDQSTA